MYSKLVLRNVKKSIKDYIIYIVTITICVTLFYSFLSISSKYYVIDIGSEYDISFLGGGLKLAILLLTLLLLFLIRFVNNYMILRKNREFAIQAVIGMEQKVIGRIFFAETLIMGVISIFIGIFLGVFFSQFITGLLLNTYGESYKITWTLFPDTVLLTIIFFISSFFVIGVCNTKTIKNTKIIDMLSLEKINEPEIRESRYIFFASVFFQVFSVWKVVTGIQKIYFFYDSRFAFSVKFMFWGNIIIPIIILIYGIYWHIKKRGNSYDNLVLGLLVLDLLNIFVEASMPIFINKYYLLLGGGTLNQYLIFILVDLFFLIGALIYLASSFFVKLKEKSLEHRYKGENLFLFGQIISKLNTTNKTMTIISSTLVLAIFLFISAPILTSWASGYLDIRSMYDIQIFSRYNNVYEECDLPNSNYNEIDRILKEENITAFHDCIFNLYLPTKEEFHNRIKHEFPVLAICLSDYNKIRNMLGYEKIILKNNEFTTHWRPIATYEEIEAFLLENKAVNTDNKILISQNSYYNEPLGETIYNSYTDVIYVFPDNACKELLPVIRNRYINTEEKINYETAKKIEKVFVENYQEQSLDGPEYGIRLSTLQINSSKANNFVLKVSMIYGAIMLMIICLTVLSLQQLMDSHACKYRFGILRKLGVEEKNIEKLIVKQLSFWFFLPIVLAIIVASIIIFYFIQIISAEISAYIGFSNMILQIGITIGILFLLLICYFFSTLILFRNSINAKI